MPTRQGWTTAIGAAAALVIGRVFAIVELFVIGRHRPCATAPAAAANQRLRAIRSFARFVASRDPARLAWYAQLRAITTKKAVPQPISWLTREEMEALIAVPDRRTLRGRTEQSLLLFLYNTGARVSETTGLQVGDLQIGWHDDRHELVTLTGKGGKTRQCPLWPRTQHTLGKLIQGCANGDPALSS
jgi:site-specific recombinase XerD